MSTKSKAQASVEYLIILAVVIIIALVVVGVLGGFPQLTSGVSQQESASYWITGDIAVTRYIQNTSGTFIFLRNNRPFKVTFALMYLGALTNNTSITSTLSPGGETSSAMTFAHSLGNNKHNCSGGGQFSQELTIGYFDDKNGFYNFTGAKKLVGTCSSQ